MNEYNARLLGSLRPMARRLNAGETLTLTQIVMLTVGQDNLTISRIALNNVTTFAMSTVATHLRALKYQGIIDYNANTITFATPR
jgi:hypothetical protein